MSLKERLTNCAVVRHGNKPHTQKTQMHTTKKKLTTTTTKRQTDRQTETDRQRQRQRETGGGRETKGKIMRKKVPTTTTTKLD